MFLKRNKKKDVIIKFAPYFLVSVSIAFLLVISLALSIENIWLLELLVSFLPLWFIKGFLSLIAAFVLIIMYPELKESLTSRYSVLVSVLSVFIALVVILVPIFDFNYKKNPLSIIPASDTLRIGFFNKKFDNVAYQKISSKIVELRLDAIAFSEISSDQYKQMTDVLKYPYSFYTNCRCKGSVDSELAIFSKYNLGSMLNSGVYGTPVIETDLLVGMNFLRLVVVHPASPISSGAFEKRNMSLEQLAENANTWNRGNYVVMGDMNTSQWSASYRNFLKKSGLSGVSKGYGSDQTWGPKIVGPQIDHIFISNDIVQNKFGIEEGLGSDHNLIWAEIGF